MSEQGETIGEVTTGNITKGSSYRYKKVINDNIKFDDDHPIKHGIIMQAHHLISETAISKSKVGTFLIANDYDINDIDNLVYIPSTLEGACHLSCQLHRGDHKSGTTESQEFDKDSDHPVVYHEFVAQLLKKAANDINVCDRSVTERKELVARKMKNLSANVLAKINSFKLPLTKIHASFDVSAPELGCKNSMSIAGHQLSGNKCFKNRDHFSYDHQFGRNTPRRTIEIKKIEYKLRQGK